MEHAVANRYAAAAERPEAGLCCPVAYDPALLSVIPAAVLERDYGCGDPVQHVREGETVIDLGCGAGKVCFIAAQIVGSAGRVIGVDSSREMLDVARSNASMVAEQIGYDVTEFVHGRIEDLALGLDAANALIASMQVTTEDEYRALGAALDAERCTHPMIADEVADIVVSNCVLNLVDTVMKPSMFDEVFRVLKPGGRAVISDIVSSTTVPQHMQDDEDLWSGCYSGALSEPDFLDAFRRAGFEGTTILDRQQDWTQIEGVTFRSVTIETHKPVTVGSRATVMYQGPFRSVEDDSGVILERGVPMSVPSGIASRLVGADARVLAVDDQGSATVPAPVPRCC